MSSSGLDSRGTVTNRAAADRGFVRAIGLFDGTMIVVGSMIGSGIFIVAADISRQTGSPGGLLFTWIFTGLLTCSAALSYGELAALMPHAGGQYVFLREAYSPLWGFLYGWTLFLVIQTVTLATKYAISLSWQQLVGVIMILFITFLNTRGVRLGKLIQNVFTTAKTLSLAELIILGLFVGRNAAALAENFHHFWTVRGAQPIQPGADFLKSFVPAVTAASGALGLFVAFAVAQVGSLFSADAWNNITFTAGEVKNPKRDVALSMALGTAIVITLYCLANLAYLTTLPLEQIQNAPDDRVATAARSAISANAGALIMAIAIIISTFGCNNGLILAGARVYYAMARDGLFFKSTGVLNDKCVPARALLFQGLWTAFLVLPRTRIIDAKTGAVTYGNLYSDLLNYVVFSVLIFYVLTIAGIFLLRKKWPDADRPYKAFGYPVVPLLYIVAAVAIMVVLILYKTETTWP